MYQDERRGSEDCSARLHTSTASESELLQPGDGRGTKAHRPVLPYAEVVGSIHVQ